MNDTEREEVYKSGRYHGTLAHRYMRRKRGLPWQSFFMRKSHHERRIIIQRPWEYPIAAMHLSAIIIQKYFRGCLCRLRFKGLLRPKIQEISEKEALWDKFTSIHDSIEDIDDLALWYKFCIIRIQAWWRMLKPFRYYQYHKHNLYHIAAVQIQYMWRGYYHIKYRNRDGLSPHVWASTCIQRAWRASTNKRIFRYYRDLITFHNTGDPIMMLKSINPSEAALIDRASGVHVRFRLGGYTFPPTIYYKLYTHRGVVDLNAFSPKNYTKCHPLSPKSIHNHPKKGLKMDLQPQKQYMRVGKSYFGINQSEMENESWYQRIENNGWRPVSIKILSEAQQDPIYQQTAFKPITFHYSKVKRQQDLTIKRKQKKREWMMKMYQQGLMQERKETNMEEIDFDSPHWEEDAEDLLEWTKDLDFDAYMNNWSGLATTVNSMTEETD